MGFLTSRKESEALLLSLSLSYGMNLCELGLLMSLHDGWVAKCKALWSSNVCCAFSAQAKKDSMWDLSRSCMYVALYGSIANGQVMNWVCSCLSMLHQASKKAVNLSSLSIME